MTATVRERSERISACATSDVVPERDSASTTSYSRAGISDAAKASVRPWPQPSRSAA